MRHSKLWTFSLLLMLSSEVLHCETKEETPSERLDGVIIEAVESYVNPKQLELTFGTGIFPLDAYHFGFSLEAGIGYYFSKTFGWEVLHGAYAFSVQKDLTAQLAQDFKVNPQVIEKLEYLVSSNLMYVPTYGKSVLFGKFIQHTRAAFLLGAGLVKTSVVSKPSISVGARWETYIGNSFSWRIEVRDHLLLEGGKQFVSVGLGTAVYF